MKSSRKYYTPQLYFCLKEKYGLSKFKIDIIAGITVAILSLSICMEFAISSGVSPEIGLYTAIIAGFFVSLLGGSRVQLSGPAIALIALGYGIIQQYGLEALFNGMLIASFLLILFGLSRIGMWIKFIPYSLIIGFTSGLAVVILSFQLKTLFGLQNQILPIGFLNQIKFYYEMRQEIHIPTFLTALSSLVFIYFLKYKKVKSMWGISTIIVFSFLCYFFDLPLETIKSHYGDLKNRLPDFVYPNISFLLTEFGTALSIGVNIAFIVALESLLSAIVGKEINGYDFRTNCELIAQGIANFVSVFFGGIPSTGSILLTAANAKSGAITPIAGIIRSVILLLIIVFFAKTASLIPLVILSAILATVSIDLFEVKHVLRICKSPRQDQLIFIVSFILTIFLNITMAVLVGIAIASLLFIRQMSQRSAAISYKKSSIQKKEDLKDFPNINVSNEIGLFEISGAIFFGNTDIFKKIPFSRISIFDLKEVHIIDASGMIAMEKFFENCKEKNQTVFFTDIKPTILKEMKRFGCIEKIPKTNIFDSFFKAVEEAEKVLKHSGI